MSIHTLAADLANRVPELAKDSKTNNAEIIEGLLNVSLITTETLTPIYAEITKTQDPKCECSQCRLHRKWSASLAAILGLSEGKEGQESGSVGDVDTQESEGSSNDNRAFCENCGNEIMLTNVPQGGKAFCAGCFNDMLRRHT